MIHRAAARVWPGTAIVMGPTPPWPPKD